MADDIGSIVAVTDASGALTNINTYDEYGRPGGANAGRFQYTGQMWLSEANLYHYRARAYAPTIGRFLQTDPILFAGGMNLYAYVGNDPVNATDPSGLERDIDMLSRYAIEGGYNFAFAPNCATEICVTGRRPSHDGISGPNLDYMNLVGGFGG